jgi:ketosteroid isomerase-like protein
MLSRRAAAIALSGAGLAAATPALSATVTDRQLIRQAYRAFNQAFGNARRVAALYADRAVLAPPQSEVIAGRANIQRFWRGVFDAGVRDHTLDLVTFRSDTRTIVTVAKWSAKGGDGSSFGGTATIVFARRADGGLRIWLHTWNLA